MLVKSCSKPGWLVRMAFAGRIDEEFSAIHEGLVDLLQVRLPADACAGAGRAKFCALRNNTYPLLRRLRVETKFMHDP